MAVSSECSAIFSSRVFLIKPHLLIYFILEVRAKKLLICR